MITHSMILLSFMIFIQASTFQIRSPVGFGIVRVVDPSSTFQEFLQSIGIPNQSEPFKGYNLISLDGFKHDSNFANLGLNPTPLAIWKNLYEVIMGNRPTLHGSDNSQVQLKVLERFHSKQAKLLMNVRLDQAPISAQQLSASNVASEIVNTLNQLKLDGISIQFSDYHSVYENTASDWLTQLLWYIRKNGSNQIQIVLVVPVTIVPEMKLFKQESVNSLVDYFVLKYFDTQKNDYTNGNMVFEKAQFYSGTSLFQLMKNEQILIDICRTLVGKPASVGSTWNQNQYVGSSSLKGGIMQGYNRYGWFGGYANLDYGADVNEMFVDELLAELRSQCLRFETCYC